VKITKYQLNKIVKEAMQISGMTRPGIVDNMIKIADAVEAACGVKIEGTSYEKKFDQLVEQIAIIVVNIKEEGQP
jgi:hypothetical protein